MLTPKLLVKGKFYPDDIEIELNEVSNRKVVPEIEAKITKVWEVIYNEAKAGGKNPYDSEGYRLDEFNVKDNKLVLTLSKILFSTRLALNKLKEELEPYGDNYFAQGISIGGFLKTSDNKYIFGEKSGKTMSKNQFDIIGGILEQIEIKSSNEILEKNKEEIKEEINVSRENIKDMFIVGIALAPTTGNIIITSTILDVTSERVLAKFKEGNDDEMSDLIFKEYSELKDYLNELGGYKPALIDLLDII